MSKLTASPVMKEKQSHNLSLNTKIRKQNTRSYLLLDFNNGMALEWERKKIKRKRIKAKSVK